MLRLGFGAMSTASHHPISCSPSLIASPVCVSPSYCSRPTRPLHSLPPPSSWQRQQAWNSRRPRPRTLPPPTPPSLLLAEAAGVEQSAAEATHPATPPAPSLLLAEAAGVEQSAAEATHPTAAQEAFRLRQGSEEVSFFNFVKMGNSSARDVCRSASRYPSFLLENPTLALVAGP